MIALTMIRLKPNGYWPSGMDQAAQANSVRDFESQIYPIWKGIEDRDIKLDTDRAMIQGDLMFECVTMHKQDRAIHQSGIKPREDNADQDRVDKMRRSDARSRSW